MKVQHELMATKLNSDCFVVTFGDGTSTFELKRQLEFSNCLFYLPQNTLPTHLPKSVKKCAVGDKIVLLALLDVTLGVAACSVYESKCNSGKCTAIKIIVSDN